MKFYDKEKCLSCEIMSCWTGIVVHILGAFVIFSSGDSQLKMLREREEEKEKII
jgi:hypothetical protein